MSQADDGREQLRQWEHSKPTNFFRADTNLQNVLTFYLGGRYAEHEPALDRFGAQCATLIDDAAKVEDRIGNHPKLERWSGIGERTEKIEFHPNHDLIGRVVWESGLMALQATPGNTVAQMGLYYLLGQNGEGGHMCSLACTSGLIRSLQQAADEAVRARFLPPLLDPNFENMQHGAQFLTEVQGGSDVGANAVVATEHGDGTWRINGEKWFCSNINADQFLMTARPTGAAEGTRGLGLFLVPRRLGDGSTNGFYIRRLKDKLGTRTLASAELDFRDAVAYPVGPVDRGFKNVVELVLNTSRLMNALGCTGAMRRAYLEAASYACYRSAFGQSIIVYPLVQEALADMRCETYAAMASSFYIAHLVDRIDTGAAADEEHAIYRLLVNVNKYITSIRATEVIHRAIEVFGGNGAIESFSILPRLYRDVIVYESWEGTHNVLCLQVLRDIAKLGLYQPFTAYVRAWLDRATNPALVSDVSRVREALAATTRMLERIGAGGEKFAQAHARRLVDSIANVAQAALLLTEAQWELDHRLPSIKPDAIRHFVNRRFGSDPLHDEDYLPRLERLSASS